MNRSEKLDQLFCTAPIIGAEIDLPEEPPRFVALEQDDSGHTLWAYFGDSLAELGNVIAESETHFIELVRVHDLDADIVLVPIWRVEGFTEIEGNFSYADGYATFP